MRQGSVIIQGRHQTSVRKTSGHRNHHWRLPRRQDSKAEMATEQITKLGARIIATRTAHYSHPPLREQAIGGHRCQRRKKNVIDPQFVLGSQRATPTLTGKNRRARSGTLQAPTNSRDRHMVDLSSPRPSSSARSAPPGANRGHEVHGATRGKPRSRSTRRGPADGQPHEEQVQHVALGFRGKEFLQVSSDQGDKPVERRDGDVCKGQMHVSR